MIVENNIIIGESGMKMKLISEIEQKDEDYSKLLDERQAQFEVMVKASNLSIIDQLRLAASMRDNLFRYRATKNEFLKEDKDIDYSIITREISAL
jgi:hypothetical protein